MNISEKSRAILEAIAGGHSFEQILSQKLKLTYNDIFRAAGEALECLDHPEQNTSYSIEEIRKQHTRAYEKWSIEEDAELAELFRSDMAANQIATKLQRQSEAFHQGEALGSDVADSWAREQGHGTGAGKNLSGATHHRLEEACGGQNSEFRRQNFQDKTGFRFCQIEAGKFRGWLFLARLPEALQSAGKQPGVLASQTFNEHIARCACDSRLATFRLARAARVGA